MDIALATAFFAGIALTLVFVSVRYESAWHRGVREGYGFARRRERYEYQEAGEYLRRCCAEEFPELEQRTHIRRRFEVYDIDDDV